MIRTAAALLAKKTAVVAITGAVVLGGATFALAEIGKPPTEEGCGTGELLNEATGLCEADPNVVPEEEPCTDDLATTDVDECAPEEEPCTDDLETTDVDECAPEEEPCTDDPATTEVDECADVNEEDVDDDAGDDEVVAEHPENHGKYVSEAAKGGGECAGLTGRDKGQCVATVAKSDAGKTGAEEEPVVEEQPVAPVVVDDSGDDAPELETAPAPAPAPKPTGKPAHAGGGKGGGKK